MTAALRSLTRCLRAGARRAASGPAMAQVPRFSGDVGCTFAPVLTGIGNAEETGDALPLGSPSLLPDVGLSRAGAGESVTRPTPPPSPGKYTPLPLRGGAVSRCCSARLTFNFTAGL